MAPCVYLSPEFACFLGPVPVVTKMPLRGHAMPTAGLGPPKRASCYRWRVHLLMTWISCEFSCFPLSLVELSPAEAKYT